jgi:hypothetical protein
VSALLQRVRFSPAQSDGPRPCPAHHRFFGLAFLLPGFVGPHLPAAFATFAAYWDFSTGILAMLALLSIRLRPLFWFFVVAFNLVGMTDLVLNYVHAMRLGIPELAGQFGAGYIIPILYVPALMITHVTAFYLLLRTRREFAPAIAHHPAT